MKSYDINASLAKSLGYKVEKVDESKLNGPDNPYRLLGSNNEQIGTWHGTEFTTWFCECPKYYKSLEICKEFEFRLTYDEQDRYPDVIARLLSLPDDWRDFNRDISQVVTAHAPIRCQAYLIIKNLWVD